jgi:hypothetical protein
VQSKRSVVIGALLIAFGVFVITAFWGDFLQFLGVRDEASRWYAFESGSGAIILGDLPLIGGLILVIRHHNCEMPGCPRIQLKRPTAAGHLLCHKHHPDPGPASLEEAHAAHFAALATRQI